MDLQRQNSDIRHTAGTEVMNSLYETLKEHQQHVTHWCYGHFHQSWHSSIDGTLFKMLDIMEFYELK